MRESRTPVRHRMAAKIEVWLDDDGRFIRQRVEGDISLEDFRQIEREVGLLVPRVRDPENVLILFDAREAAKGTLEARRAMAQALGRPNLRRMAVVQPSLIGRIMVRFMTAVSGQHKIGIFEDEGRAVQWLLS
jgi:SpoIIAA-like